MQLLRLVYPRLKRWATAVWHGLCLRCPRCGQGRIHNRLFKRRPFCSVCCLNWTLDDGRLPGGSTLNAAVTGITSLLVYGGLFVLQIPNKLPALLTFGLVMAGLFHRHAIGASMAVSYLKGAFQHGPPEEALALEES